MNRRAFLRMAPLAPLLPLVAAGVAAEAKSRTVTHSMDASEIRAVLDQRDRNLRDQIVRDWHSGPGTFPGAL